MKKHYHYYVVYSFPTGVGALEIKVNGRKQIFPKDILEWEKNIEESYGRKYAVIQNFIQIGCNCEEKK